MREPEVRRGSWLLKLEAITIGAVMLYGFIVVILSLF